MTYKSSFDEIADSFKEYLIEYSVLGSNMPGSYVQSIHKLNKILKEKTELLGENENLWNFYDVQRLTQIYNNIIVAQKQKNGGFFDGTGTPSYWKKYFYSSAIKMFSRFITLEKRKNHMLELARINTDGALLAEKFELTELTPNSLYWDDDVSAESLIGKERLSEIKVRENQNVFRKIVLHNYQYKCCLCELPIVETLRASHISPWAKDTKNRMNPENGLCLAATYDAAFDRHLISFDENYRLLLSSSLHEYCTNQAFNDQFKKMEGRVIKLPNKFLPSKMLLAKHRESLL